MGALSATFLERCGMGDLASPSLAVDGYEFGAALLDGLSRTLAGYAERLPLAAQA
jgi:hypothetical protein